MNLGILHFIDFKVGILKDVLYFNFLQQGECSFWVLILSTDWTELQKCALIYLQYFANPNTDARGPCWCSQHWCLHFIWAKSSFMCSYVAHIIWIIWTELVSSKMGHKQTWGTISCSCLRSLVFKTIVAAATFPQYKVCIVLHQNEDNFMKESSEIWFVFLTTEIQSAKRFKFQLFCYLKHCWALGC